MSGGRRNGFTLPEMLVTLVVVGLLLAGLTRGVQFGVVARDTQAHWREQQVSLDPVDRALRRLVMAADPGSFEEQAGLVGTRDRLELITELPASASGMLSKRVHAGLAVDQAHRLVLRWTPAPHAIMYRASEPRTVSLIDHVERLELAYWRPAREGGGWLDIWNGRNLPGLIRIRIVFPPGDPRHWPDIVVAPMREGNRA